MMNDDSSASKLRSYLDLELRQGGLEAENSNWTQQKKKIQGCNARETYWS